MVLSILKLGLLRTTETIPRLKNKFNRHQEENAIVNHVVDEILLQEDNKISAEAEAHENIES